VDPWVEFEAAGRGASEAGVRLAHAVEVIIADGAGKEEELRAAIRRHADSLDKYPPNKEFQLLDVVANQLITGISDRLWTEGTGARTPVGALGTFWDDKKEETMTLDIDDLLEDF